MREIKKHAFLKTNEWIILKSIGDSRSVQVVWGKGGHLLLLANFQSSSNEVFRNMSSIDRSLSVNGEKIEKAKLFEYSCNVPNLTQERLEQ